MNDSTVQRTSQNLEYIAKIGALAYIGMHTHKVGLGDIARVGLHEGAVYLTKKIPLVGGLVSTLFKFQKPYRNLAVRKFDLDEAMTEFTQTYNTGSNNLEPLQPL